jgi:hypothetical protein
VGILAAEVNGGDAQRSRLTGLTVVFSENVGASVTMADVVLRNLTTFTEVASASLTRNYDDATNTLTIGLAGGVTLPDGDYQMALRAAGITDGGGRALDADAELSFHILIGDTNGDRIVNEPDLFLVWRSLLQPPANRDLQFDLNNDRIVSGADVDVIRARYQNELDDSASPGIAAAAAVGERSDDDGMATRIIPPMAESSDAAAAPGQAPLPEVADQNPSRVHPVRIEAAAGLASSHASMEMRFGGGVVLLQSRWPESARSWSRRDRFNVFDPFSDDLRSNRQVPVHRALWSLHALVEFPATFDPAEERALSAIEEFELPSIAPA